MLARLKDLFSPATQEEDHLDPEQLRVATCVILLEVARSDDEFSDGEREKIVGVLTSRYALSKEDAHELIETATRARDESYDLFQFTSRINESCSINEKLEIIEEIWHVVYADHSLDGHEDYVMHKLRKLFNLTHGQLIDAKVRVLDTMRDKL